MQPLNQQTCFKLHASCVVFTETLRQFDVAVPEDSWNAMRDASNVKQTSVCLQKNSPVPRPFPISEPICTASPGPQYTFNPALNNTANLSLPVY